MPLALSVCLSGNALDCSQTHCLLGCGQTGWTAKTQRGTRRRDRWTELRRTDGHAPHR